MLHEAGITSAAEMAEHIDSRSDISVKDEHKRHQRPGMVWGDTYVRSDGVTVHGHWRKNARR